MLVKESLSPGGALFAFGGWLTSRDKVETFSAKHDAVPMANLIGEFIDAQGLDMPEGHWENDIISMKDGNYIAADFISIHDDYKLVKEHLFEKKSNEKEHINVKGQVEKSKKIPKEMKEKIIPLIIRNGIHGTRYNNGRVYSLKIPKVSGKSFKGVSLGADKNGFFVHTHRAASKRYSEVAKIPNSAIKFIESTG